MPRIKEIEIDLSQTKDTELKNQIMAVSELAEILNKFTNIERVKIIKTTMSLLDISFEKKYEDWER